jgi:glycine hydroxymethyltransferase
VSLPAITTRGMREKDMETVVELVDRVSMNIDDAKTIKSVSEEVKSWMQQFPLYPELG